MAHAGLEPTTFTLLARPSNQLSSPVASRRTSAPSPCSTPSTSPPTPSRAPSLSALDLARNRLDGDLPTSIWNLCDRVTELRLHGNALTGAVPALTGPNTTCDRLRVLDLDANRFSGGFPAFLTAFRGL
ncbi:putative kinase-like protein TMKL1 [Miscanthus floridulus]|uniref:putative kinase-like protein TMKL1 n=1 Tax=Miscanthus floridulus TaxID=154761 RepID=UPI0034592A35